MIEPRTWRSDRWQVTIRDAHDPWCSSFEADLESAGIPIAASHRTAWARLVVTVPTLFVGVSDGAGHPRYSCIVERPRVRMPPGHRLFRVKRFASSGDVKACVVAMRQIVAAARETRYVLRVDLELFSPSAERLRDVAAQAASLGFVSGTMLRTYDRTRRVDLGRSLDEILRSFSRSGRRNVRAVGKHCVDVRVIDDVGAASDLAALEAQAFIRTGARPKATNWPGLLAFCRQNPRLGRVVGMYGMGGDCPTGLLGFAHARSHGDHVEYSQSGTVRREGLNLPISYVLIWDLMEWAHSIGAQWFDMGGITPATSECVGDSLAGISAFKRHFGGKDIQVGEEWSLDLCPVRSRLARLAADTAAAARRVGLFNPNMSPRRS